MKFVTSRFDYDLCSFIIMSIIYKAELREKPKIGIKYYVINTVSKL